MERSKSFHTFNFSHKDNNNDNRLDNGNRNQSSSSNNNNKAVGIIRSMSSNHNISTSSLTNLHSIATIGSSSHSINQTAMNLRKDLELRHTHLQKQQLQLSGSSDNVAALKAAATAGLSLQQLLLPNAVLTAAATAMRKKLLLQRQKSTEYADEVLLDYAIDAEHNEENEQPFGEEVFKQRQLQSLQQKHTALQQKRMLFQQKQLPLSHGSYGSLPMHLHASGNESTTNPIPNVADASVFTPTGHSTPPLSPTATKLRNTSTSSVKSLDASHARLKHEDSFDSATDVSSPTSNRRHQFAALKRDNSTHSDSSRYSSVDSLLESRKPDPEAILINLGFGPGSEDVLARIPKRFLKPSQVRGIDTDAFVKRLQLSSTLADHSALGYRGLTGNPDMPPSTIVAKIMHRFEANERKKSMGSVEHTIR